MDQRRDIDRRAEPEPADSARLETDVDRTYVREHQGRQDETGVRRPEGDLKHSREWAVPGNDRTTSERKRSPEEIGRDIRRTRAEMTETINEIEDRLSPRHLKAQLRDTVHHTIDSVQDRFSPARMRHTMERKAKRTGENMLESVKENPLPAVLTALGLAWWIRSANEHGGNDFRTSRASRYPRTGRRMYADDDFGDEYYGYRNPDYMGDRYAAGPYYAEDSMDDPMYDSETARYEAYPEGGDRQSTRERVADSADDMKHRAGDKARELQHRAEDTAHELQHRAGDAARQAQRGVRRAGRRIESGAGRATHWMDDMMHRNPVAAGAIALGIGAAVGAALPHTRQEDEWMGEYRDDVVDMAEDRGREYAEKAKHVAEHTAQEVKQSVKDVAASAKETVKEDARNEGLTGSSSGSPKSGSSGSGSNKPAGASGGTAARTTTATTETTTASPGSATPGKTGTDRNKPGSNS